MAARPIWCQGASPQPPAGPRRMPTRDEERVKRLAEALRENLRKRKAQARAGESPRRKPGPMDTEPEG